MSGGAIIAPAAPMTSSGVAGHAETAVAFLRLLRPDGPWVLTAIEPDKGIQTITAETDEAVRDFVREYDGRRNLYFMVNPAKRRLSSKAKKSDVEVAEFVFADLDPENHESPEAAKARYLAGLQTFGLQPAFLINSGNGLQAIWRLAVSLGPGAFTQAEAISQAMMVALGSAAGTQNVDRIFRLPGTTNIPNKAKLARGRVPCPTALIDHSSESHPIEAFKPFLDAAAEKGGANNANGHGPSGASKRANGIGDQSSAGDEVTAAIDVDALPVVDVDVLPLTPRIRNMIRTGEDTEDDAPFADRRSERAFAVLIAMAAAGSDVATMASVMLDTTLPIGAHVRDQSDCVKYLQRQIAKARKRASHPAVAELNETYALVIAGSSADVLQEYTDAEGRKTFRLLPLASFRAWLANETVPIGDNKRAKLAEYWLQHPRRRQYSSIIFAPGRDPRGMYNLWRGFVVEPRPGDCSKFLDHLLCNICRGNEEHYRWVVGWFADIIQNPATKCGTSLVLRGKQGTGKTKVGEIMGSILGQHYTLVADPRYITGRFNSHLIDCLLLHADEAFWAGDHAAEGKLKDLVTGREQLIEFKGKEPIRVRNYVRLFVNSNSDWVVPAGLEERRFAVLDVGEDQMQKTAYFAAIDEEMNNGGREALLEYLLCFDLKTVDLRSIPRTAALVEQKINSLNTEQAWWLDTLNRGELPWGCDAANECPTKWLFDRYVEHAKRRGVPRRSIETALGMFLRKNVRGLRKKDGWVQGRDGTTVSDTVYQFPPLIECRAEFAKAMQMEPRWDGKEEWWSEPPPEPHDGGI